MDKKKANPIGLGFNILVISLVIIALGYFINSLRSTPEKTSETLSDVKGSGDVQYIDMTAKGGYTPNSITAKANTKTILKVKTSNTFDCSSAIVIPGIGYRDNLPPTAVTEITIPPQKENTVLKGTCSMGMYRFSIKFI
jgi:plastocyanin domain-containing protein